MSTHTNPDLITARAEALAARDIARRLPGGWTYRPARDIDDPEASYWIARMEAAALSMSPDMVLAAQHEYRRADLRMGPVERHVTAAAAGLWVAAVIGVGFGWAIFDVISPALTHGLSTSAVGDAYMAKVLPLMYATAVGFTAIYLGAGARRMVLRYFAHRAVVARDRLDRWLPPITAHPLYPLAPSSPAAGVAATTGKDDI